MNKLIFLMLLSIKVFSGTISDTSMYIATGTIPSVVSSSMSIIAAQVNAINQEYNATVLKESTDKNKNLLDIRTLEIEIFLEMTAIRKNQEDLVNQGVLQ